jgi:hypothetical protein
VRLLAELVAWMLGALLFLTLTAPPSHADTIKNKGAYFQLHLPAGWRRIKASPGSEKLLVSYRDGSGQVLAVVQASHPNRGAWRNRKEFFDHVEAGFKKATTGYKQLYRRVRKLGRVPSMEIDFTHEREGRTEMVMVKIIFFRTFTLSLSIAGDGSHRKRNNTVLRSFKPYFSK